MTSSLQQQPIAVVGMACRLPGADDVDQFWNMLVEGRSAIARIPDERLDRRLYYSPQRGKAGVSYAEKAALIDYSRDTIPDQLITPQDLREHDLAHVVLCRVAAESLKDARLDRTSLRGRRAGVYVGHATESGRAGQYSYGVHIAQTAELLRGVDGFRQLAPEVQDATIEALKDDVRSRMPWRTADCNPNLEACQAARLIAAKFGFDGPQMVFNSACASSLQALAHAMKALSLGRVDMAVVGGASCFHSDTLVLFSQAQSLSTSGSFPFTEAADGLIVGEGYVSFVLKRLADAVVDKDRILAVLPSVGIASDGHGKSLWAPRIEGQIEAILRAYPDKQEIAGLDYIEAHATSTNLGDRTEIEAIARVLREHLAPGAAIPIGGVKRNVGHTLEVAGAAGLLKVILAMRHGVIPPAVDGSQPLASGVDWKSLPVFVNDRPIAWPKRDDHGPCRAAVNAFGIGGLNVHLVVESYAPQRYASAVPAARPGGRGAANPTGDASDIAIVGMGVVLPGAREIGAFRDLLESGRCAIGAFPADNWEPRLFADDALRGGRAISLPAAGAVVGFEYDWRKHRIPPKQLAQANPLQFMMLDAVDQAFQQSGLREHARFDRMRTGCIVGTKFGGDFSAQLLMGLRIPDSRQVILEKLANRGVAPQEAAAVVEAWKEKVLERFPALIDESGSFTASALASRITKSFDLMGGGIAVDAGDLGSFAALASSADMLLSGACDTMVCVAGEDSLLPETYQFAALSGRMAASSERACPFDAKANGSIPGVGAVALLLKRLDDANRDGLKVLGVIKGIGVSSGERLLAVRQAADQACSLAGITPGEVSGIETVGSGVAALDSEELDGLAKSYAAQNEFPLSTLVGQIGHLGSAAGLASLAAAALALEHERLPAASDRYQPTRAIQQSKFKASAKSQALTTADPQGRLYVGLNGTSSSISSYHVILQRGEPVMPQPIQPALNSTSPWQTETLPGGALIFDATIRRRERLRRLSNESSRGGGQALPAAPAASPTASGQAPSSISPARSAASNGLAPATIGGDPAPSPTSPVEMAPSRPAPPAATAPAATGGKAQSALSHAEVESFLISFVMEQTGYPREIVDLDADLESDLGIDSIKKAQLFGELGEYFDVQASADLSLDAFPTLRTVMNFLLAANPDAATPNGPPAAASQSAAPSPAASEVSPATTSPTPGLEPAEVETFLINFVMEQTGYPREIVDLDADLESDLGIDSIKKAQLFGELGEYFDVQASADLSLDAFPTLRTVMNFLLAAAPGETASNGPPAAAPQSAAPSPAASEVSPAPAASTPGLEPAEVETFLINFVMEQTGYPREIVDLDADLESDLGIDSIKKAQLFGELGEYFDVQASADLSLDAFPTLRTVMNFLLAATPNERAAEPDARADVESFVINFVMKQTGYPRQVIDLDGDFEIDLGIDRRQQADMLHRLSDFYPDPALRSQQFDTLRSVIDYLRNKAPMENCVR